MADDDEDDRFLVKSVFDTNWQDCEVVFAVDGADLLERLDQSDRRPALILLDLNMPRMDGFAALRHIRANPAYRSIPVIIFTTSSAPEHIMLAYELGANSFLTKPSSFSGLSQLIHQVRLFWLDLARVPANVISPSLP
ncbi:response regulator [Tellurirhabdus rosea]|uniref:response regulator n=1 Tax=Tellurirhabdus rosea TaxID=2674997 RepID=UPI0022557EDF|nr:response regulator [Tellurirhabdus rosea]